MKLRIHILLALALCLSCTVAEAARIRNSEKINHAMWPVTKDTNGDIDLSFTEAVARMKQSYETKFEFMDKNINKM